MNDLLYKLALTLVPNIGDVQAKLLLNHFEDCQSIFKSKKKTLNSIPGLSYPAIQSINEFTNFDIAEKEMNFIEENNIRPLFYKDVNYPKRLHNCVDSPILLFHKGNIDFNNSRTVSIVGTRSFSDYGRRLTESLVRDLAPFDIMIVSGLAHGIDAIAHKAALKNQIPTAGIVGHGLQYIYPPENNTLARDMIEKSGGILTEFFSDTIADRHNFPLRNRIVAGMSDATIVIESPIKGGSLITAKLADGYNRDVFAAPGRATDKVSEGCNYLIKHNKAIMFTEADDIINAMGWNQKKKENGNSQRMLFIELTPDEQLIIELLKEKESFHIDEINLRSGLSCSSIASVLLNLEIQNIVKGLPGKMYSIL